MSAHNICFREKIRDIIRIPTLICSYSPQNINRGYSLEAPRQDSSNEYPQYMHLWKNKKDMWIPTLICSFSPHICLGTD